MSGNDNDIEGAAAREGGLSRRELLKRGAMLAAGVTAMDAWWNAAAGLAAESSAAPLALGSSAAAAQPRAKSVIQVWMWGGPSHLDTFDPKPEAGYDYCGPLSHPLATNVAGVRVCELMPLLAKQADQYSIIRSMTHGVNAHETASYIVQTGRQPGRLSFPCIGAMMSLLRGYDHGYKGKIPPYVVLTQSQGRFAEEGFLGPRYRPFVTGGDPNQKVFYVEGIVAQGMTDARQASRRQLLHGLDSLGQAMPRDEQFRHEDATEKDAYDMILGDARKLFDLSQEKDALRQRYGRSTFGQSCLMARRLAEAGVPYVTINYPGWDTHKQNFETMRRKLPEMDRGMATLLSDLKDRGLLDDTIVWWGGEFGRTPKVQWEAPWNGGRGHYGECFTHVVAGGGFKGGHVVGASDAKGMEVAERPVSPRDLIGSMLSLLGYDPAAPLPNARGLQVAMTAPESESAIKGDGFLKEIM